MYQYFLYGVGIHSEIKLYNLPEKAVEREIIVHYGTISHDIAEYTENGVNSTISSSRAWFRNDIGYFVITGGNDIMVQPIAKGNEEELASFVLGWCMAFLFQFRGFSAIHSSAIEIGNQAVLISGFSGSGKSTTALSMIKAGYRYLADDIAMVNPADGCIIQPAFPQQKVCRNIAEKMNAEELIYINERKDKFAHLNTGDFCDQPRKLSALFMLNRYEGQEVRAEKMKGIDKLNAVLKNLFLLDAYRAMGFPVEEQKRGLEIAGMIDVYRILRPREGDTVEQVRDAIIKIVEQGE